MITVFARSFGPAVQCDDCLGMEASAVALDDSTPYTYSKGSVQIGYIDNGTQIITGGSVKSSGTTPPTTNGGTAGGTTCDSGIVIVTAGVPQQGTGPVNGHYGWRTIVKVYLNSSLLTTVMSPIAPFSPDTVQQTIFTRGINDEIIIEYDSEYVP